VTADNAATAGAASIATGEALRRMREQLRRRVRIWSLVLVAGVEAWKAEQSLAAMARITSIPTLMGFREGVLVFSQPGALPAVSLEQVIAGIRALDMDEIRAEATGSQTTQSQTTQSQTTETQADGAAS